jgi:hypothetical protein
MQPKAKMKMSAKIMKNITAYQRNGVESVIMASYRQLYRRQSLKIKRRVMAWRASWPGGMTAISGLGNNHRR